MGIKTGSFGIKTEGSLIFQESNKLFTLLSRINQVIRVGDSLYCTEYRIGIFIVGDRVIGF